jgi:hypothetical protein
MAIETVSVAEFQAAQEQLSAALARIVQLETVLGDAGVMVPAPDADVEKHLAAAKAARA